MKKLFSVLILLAFVSVLPLAAFAAGSYVNDSAGLLTFAGIQVLEEECVSFHNEYGMDLAYLTVESLGGRSAVDYADEYFERYYGPDGVLFLIAWAEREWYISTSGSAIQALSDHDLMAIEEEIIPYLSSGQFDDAFFHFQVILPDYLANKPDSDFSIVFSLLAGGIIAGIVILIMRSSMNTKRPQRSAANYETDGSYHLRQHQDLFLYSNVAKRPRPQNNSSGGSSVHRSSSGRSHGGRGGRF